MYKAVKVYWVDMTTKRICRGVVDNRIGPPKTLCWVHNPRDVKGHLVGGRKCKLINSDRLAITKEEAKIAYLKVLARGPEYQLIGI